MTVHLVGLPHTPYDDVLASTCAFTSKAVRTERMLKMRGIDVVTYWGGDRADVSLLTAEEQISYFGEWKADALPDIDWDVKAEHWRKLNARAITALTMNLKSGDIIASTAGAVHQPIIDHFQQSEGFKNNFICIESGVGYEGLCRGTFACFESYAWMHNRYGAYNIGDGRAFDTVIPNAVVPDEWEMAPSKGYALFVGRLIARKGPHVAGQIAEALGMPLVMAGAGVAHQEPGLVIATDGTRITGDVTHVGAVGGAERRTLFAEAEVFICPTLYIGPWEGVHAEAMMSGVPVIASDWGVFTETLHREQRFRSLNDAVEAALCPVEPRGEWWRQYAIDLCGIERCADLYADWIDRLGSLRGGRKGWYEMGSRGH